MTGTFGTDYKQFLIKIADRTVKLQLWDTPGRERFRTISSAYFRGADGIFVVYDLTSRRSFDQGQLVIAEVEKFADADVRRMLIGNKLDDARRREVSEEEGLALAREHGMTFLETSALTGENVELALRSIVTPLLLLRAAQKDVRAGAAAAVSPTARSCSVC